MNTTLKSNLYYSEGSSNKEYHAELVEVTGGYVVNFSYGRRGGTLTTGTKTVTPVDHAQAQSIYAKLIQAKIAKGYLPDSDASWNAYQHTQCNGVSHDLASDFMPQLCNPINTTALIDLMQDDNWALQQKMDGERRAAHAEAIINAGNSEGTGEVTGEYTDGRSSVIGMNRKGLVVALPQGIADELQSIANSSGTIRVDGEIIGDVLHIFDLLIHQGAHLHTLPWLERMRIASIAISQCQYIKAIPVAISTQDKRKLWYQVNLQQGEGVVFKRINAPVTAGRPNSGGDWLKFKFTESASCYVSAINPNKRSIKISLFDSSNSANSKASIIPVGNVTIPPNYDIPATGDVVEVEYLYAYKGGSIYQPVYRGKRTDLDLSACRLDQLKYKPDACSSQPSDQTAEICTC
ncbi:DNA ligase [mine drainage metagenome]|uniref:DNA ligase n=1 Tax=mine drainage metagenome TaxID=410659 RepID=A0A1J5RLL5_9ZZZZ